MRFIKPGRRVTRVFIHCSASDNPRHDNAATMDAWHKQRGWSGIGYHFFIRKSGLVEHGRSIDKTPAAQGGNNRATIAICLHGLAKSKFTKKQFDALLDLCHQIDEAYDGKVTFHGHCEVAAKACPVIDYKKVLTLNAQGRFLGKKPEAASVTPGNDLDLQTSVSPSADHVLRIGSKGLPVELLQRRLTDLGYHVGQIDGHFGKRTRAAVLAFQADNDLITDGAVGAATYEAFIDAEAREIDPARAGVDVAALATGGSRIADASLKGGGAGATVTSLGLMSAVGEFSDQFQTLKAQVEPIAEPFGGLNTFLLIGLLVVVGYMTWQFVRSGQARAEDHRTGKTP